MNRYLTFDNCFVKAIAMFILGVVFVDTLTAGNERTSAQIVGMGRTFTASSRGLDALGLNPANLALDDRNATVTFQIAPFGFRIGSDLINYQIYNDYFTGTDVLTPDGKRSAKKLSAQDKQDILGLFPEGNAHTYLGLDVVPFGISAKIGKLGLALSANVRNAVNLELPEGYLKFLLNGLDSSGSYYSFDGTAVGVSSIAEFNLAGGYLLPYQIGPVKDIAVGVGLKYLLGLAYLGTDHYTANLQNIVYRNPNNPIGIDSIQLKGYFDFLQYQSAIGTDGSTSPVGSGIGFDIGVSAEVLNGLRVGASVTDIGKMTWDKNTKAITGHNAFTFTNLRSESDTLKNAFKGETRDTTSFTADLPTAFHLGAAFQVDKFFEKLPFRWLMAADLHLGFNNQPGNTTTPIVGLGTELDFLAGWLPLRTGVLIGGRERFAWSAGLGIHIANTLDIDMATESIAILTSPNSFRNGSFTLGLRWRI